MITLLGKLLGIFPLVFYVVGGIYIACLVIMHYRYHVVTCLPFVYPSHMYYHVRTSSVLASGKYLNLPGI